MIKFVLRSIHNLHAESSLNEMFSFEPPIKTRSSNFDHLHVFTCSTKIERFSVQYRATKVYNLLLKSGAIPENVRSFSVARLVDLVSVQFLPVQFTPWTSYPSTIHPIDNSPHEQFTPVQLTINNHTL